VKKSIGKSLRQRPERLAAVAPVIQSLLGAWSGGPPWSRGLRRGRARVSRRRGAFASSPLAAGALVFTSIALAASAMPLALVPASPEPELASFSISAPDVLGSRSRTPSRMP